MLKKFFSLLVGLIYLSGCSLMSSRVTSAPPSFNSGMAALHRGDFPIASYHFAELAKDGDPSSMNNLGVALMMVGRRDDAVYWFSSAARYGDVNAPTTLRKLGEPVPPADLVGKHPSQVSAKRASNLASDIFAIVAIGALIGITGYYVGKGGYGSANNQATLYRDLLIDDASSRKSSAPPNRPEPATQFNNQVFRDIEVRDVLNPGTTYKGTVDKFGNVDLRSNAGPGTTYRGSIDQSGSGTATSSTGSRLKINP